MTKALELRVDDVLAEVDLPCLRGQDEVCARIIDRICVFIRKIAATTKERGKTENALLDAVKDRMTILGGTFLSPELSPSAVGNLLNAVSHAMQKRIGVLLQQNQGDEPPEQWQRGVPSHIQIKRIRVNKNQTPTPRSFLRRPSEDDE